MKALVIVAHPDDETIWSGGLIMQHLDWDWTIMSLCRSDDHDRARRFRAVCELLGADGLISDLDDGDPLAPINTRREIGNRIMECLPSMEWDLCVTHGENGEYGHRRHKEVQTEVLGLVQDGILECRDLWTFSYDCDAANGDSYLGAYAQRLVHLTEDQFDEKLRIVRDIYGYRYDSFEANACVAIEGFRNWGQALKEWAA